jgi:hypothetical protein
MGFYVKRINPNGNRAITGPIRSRAQAEKEAASWRDMGHSVTIVEKGDPDLKPISKEMAARRQHNVDVGYAPRKPGR